jgi:hypothetical protein
MGVSVIAARRLGVQVRLRLGDGPMAVTHAGQADAHASHAGFTTLVRAWLRAATGRLAGWRPTSAARASGAPIGPAERVLITGRDVEGLLVAATKAAVYCQDGPTPGRPWSRLGWEDVGGVEWDERRHVLTLTGVRPGGHWQKELALPSHTPLVEFARERLTSTLLASAAVRLGDRVCAWVTARHQPGSGKVVWVVVLDEAGDINAPAIRAEVEAAIADLQAQTGITADAADLKVSCQVAGMMPR